MSQFIKENKTNMRQCPYNPSHFVSEGRFLQHIIKCKKDYKGNDLIECPFKMTHIMPKAELEKHIATCPEAAAAMKRKREFEESLEQSRKERSQVREPPVASNSEEPWDNDTLPPLPENSKIKSLESRAQMPQLAGLKPAQKRKIHKELESGALSGDAQWVSREVVWDDEPEAAGGSSSPPKSIAVDSLSVVSAPPAAQIYRLDARGANGLIYKSEGAAAGTTATSRAGASSSGYVGPQQQQQQQQQQRVPGTNAAAASSNNSASASSWNSNRRLAP